MKIARKSQTSVESINYRSHTLNGHPRGIATLSTYDRSYQKVLKLSLVSDYSFNKVLHYKYSAHYIFDCFIYCLPFFKKKLCILTILTFFFLLVLKYF